MRDEIKGNFDWAQSRKNKIAYVIKNYSGDIIKIEDAPPEEDMKECTDFKIQLKQGNMAARIRRPGVWERYQDFTIRTKTTGEGLTEINKLPYVDDLKLYLYAWDDKSGLLFMHWCLLNVPVFQKYLKESGYYQNYRDWDRPNPDGSRFLPIPLARLRKLDNLILAEGGVAGLKYRNDVCLDDFGLHWSGEENL